MHSELFALEGLGKQVWVFGFVYGFSQPHESVCLVLWD